MPITRQPLSFAICPAMLPVAPAAPLTTTVSPARGRPRSSIPKYAVMPVPPNTPSAATGSVSDVNTRRSFAFTIACVCMPSVPPTRLPTGTLASRDTSTTPTPPARITSPIASGAT